VRRIRDVVVIIAASLVIIHLISPVILSGALLLFRLGNSYVSDVENWVESWQHYLVGGDPGTLLYAASFDGGGTDGFNGDWQQYPGRLSAQIAGGQMTISVGEANGGAYSYAAPHFGDFDLRVEAQAVSGPVDNGYGVIFRLQNKDNANDQDDSYYLFLISSDGYYRISRVVDGDEKILSDWIDSTAIQQGLNAVNRLRVVARGDQFHFYVNDQPLQVCIPDDPNGVSTYSGGACVKGTMQGALIDDTIPNGQIGVSALWTADANEQPVVAAFDTLLVYAPPAS